MFYLTKKQKLILFFYHYYQRYWLGWTKEESDFYVALKKDQMFIDYLYDLTIKKQYNFMTQEELGLEREKTIKKWVTTVTIFAVSGILVTMAFWYGVYLIFN